MPTHRSFLSLLTAATAWHGLVARAQERFSPFLGSNVENVRRMVALAAPRSDKTVIDGAASAVRKWIVPARIEGGWDLGSPARRPHPPLQRAFEQRMQQAEGATRVGNRREIFQNVILRGEALQFSLRMTLPGVGFTQLGFVGRVPGDAVEGSADAAKLWR